MFKKRTDEAMAEARAAIEAMREPTDAMVSANSDAAGPDDGQTIEDWNAMIDAALSEPTMPGETPININSENPNGSK